METMIKKMIKVKRNGKLWRKGLLVAKKNGDYVKVGWSLACWRDIRTKGFDEDLAKSIAFGRIETDTNIPVPLTLKDEMSNFVDRCSRYFKTNNIIVAGGELRSLALKNS